MADSVEACSVRSRHGKALVKAFKRIVKKFGLRLSGAGIQEFLAAGKPITQADIEERRQVNLDKDGKCKLKADEDIGGCLSIPDVKYLVAKALALK